MFIRRLLGASFGVSKKNARHKHFLCNLLNTNFPKSTQNPQKPLVNRTMQSYFAPDAENTASLYYMNAFCGEAASGNIHAIRRNEVQNRPFYIR